jgi:hypothetical protein
MEEPTQIDNLLLSKERIEWFNERRTSFWYACGGLLIIFIFAYPVMNPEGVDLLYLLLGGIYSILVASTYLLDRVLYPQFHIITNKRILNIRGKRIMGEIERSRFGKRPLNEFIGKRIVYYSSKDAYDPISDVFFYDPDTSEPLLKFGGLYSSELGYRPFYQAYFHECPSCGLFIFKEIDSCHECGQSFL